MNALIVISVLSSVFICLDARFHHGKRKESFDNLMEPDELFAMGLKQALVTVHRVQKISDEKDGFGAKSVSRALDSGKHGRRHGGESKKEVLWGQIKRVKKIDGNNLDSNDVMDKDDGVDKKKSWRRKWGKKDGRSGGRKVSKEVTVEKDAGMQKKLDVQKKGKVEGVKSVQMKGSKVASGTFSATWKSSMVKKISWGNQNLTETDRVNKEGKIVGVIGSDGRKTVNVIKVIKAGGNKDVKSTNERAKSVDVSKSVKAE